MTSRQSHVWCMVAIFALTLLVSACGGPRVVGVLYPETGADAPRGKSIRRGTEIGIQHALEDGMDPDAIRVVWADSASDPDAAGRATRRLAREDHAKIIVTAVNSEESETVTDALEETMTVGLAPTAIRVDLIRKSELVYSIALYDFLAGSLVARFLAADRGEKTVLIVASAAFHELGLESQFREVFVHDFKATITDRISLDGDDWEPRIRNVVRDSAPEGVYLITGAEDAKRVLGVLRDEGYEGTVCGTSAINSRPVIEGDPSLFDQVHFPQAAYFDVASSRPGIQRFVAAYRGRFGEDPDHLAAYAYDAIRVVLDVAVSADEYEILDIQKKLRFGLGEYLGVTGTIVFDDHGGVRRFPVMHFFRDGAVQPVPGRLNVCSPWRPRFPEASRNVIYPKVPD